MPTAKKKSSAESLALRIIVLDPPPNILWALQLGQDEIGQTLICDKGPHLL